MYNVIQLSYQKTSFLFIQSLPAFTLEMWICFTFVSHPSTNCGITNSRNSCRNFWKYMGINLFFVNQLLRIYRQKNNFLAIVSKNFPLNEKRVFLNIYMYGTQLEPSSGVNSPLTRRTISTIHHIPTPPNVSNFPTAVPVWPRQNRSIPKNPRRMLYISVVVK